MSEEHIERRDALREGLHELRQELRRHIEDEGAILTALGRVVIELGTPDQVRERRIFIEMLMDREKDRVKLRRAIIEKSVIGAVWAVLVFVVIAVGREIIALVNK